MAGDDFVESAAFPGAVIDHGLRTGDGGDCPVLGSPDEGLLVLLEEKGVCHNF